MFSTETHGLPATSDSFPVVLAASGPAERLASGTAPGHMGTWACPGDGCQTGSCALKTPIAKTTKRAKIKDFIKSPQPGYGQLLAWLSRVYGGLRGTFPHAAVGIESVNLVGAVLRFGNSKSNGKSNGNSNYNGNSRIWFRASLGGRRLCRGRPGGVWGLCLRRRR